MYDAMFPKHELMESQELYFLLAAFRSTSSGALPWLVGINWMAPLTTQSLVWDAPYVYAYCLWARTLQCPQWVTSKWIIFSIPKRALAIFQLKPATNPFGGTTSSRWSADSSQWPLRLRSTFTWRCLQNSGQWPVRLINVNLPHRAWIYRD